MRIGIFDPAGLCLGPAVGLVELGHRVTYAGPEAWSAADASESARCAGALAAHCCGRVGAPPDPAAFELLVVVDVFADYLRCLAQRQDHAAIVYPTLLRRWLDIAARSAHPVIVDGSDDRGPREVAFEAMAHATLLRRECDAGDRGPWQPLPFLYNNVLLWLEYMRPESEWLVPAHVRPQQWDWAFCGTLDHARYGDSRHQALAALARRWPHLRGIVCVQEPFVSVLRVLQSVRLGVDLPGAGELCFRLHETLALGTPVLRPQAATIVLPPGLEGVVGADPAALSHHEPDGVRTIYREHYGPRAAATALLAAAARDRPGAPSQAPSATVPVAPMPVA